MDAQSRWIDCHEACAILGVKKPQLHRITHNGGITTKRLPYCRPRYSRADCERLAARCIREATVEMAAV